MKERLAEAMKKTDVATKEKNEAIQAVAKKTKEVDALKTENKMIKEGGEKEQRAAKAKIDAFEKVLLAVKNENDFLRDKLKYADDEKAAAVANVIRKTRQERYDMERDFEKRIEQLESELEQMKESSREPGMDRW